jgi:lipid-binding SYLF domain-containing protein
MKTILLGLLLLGFVGTALGLEPSQLDNRIKMLTAKLDAMQRKADKRIPADLLKKAQAIILLDRTKAGLVFGYQGGGGLAMAKDPKTEKWSPVAFMSSGEASFGFQMGGEQGFYAILLMTTNATQMLMNSNVRFGGEARGTAGDMTGDVETVTQQPIVVYADRSGLYGGAVVKGGSISGDNKANQVYYGTPVSVNDILYQHKVQPGEPASYLIERLNSYSQSHGNSKSIWN